MQRALCRWPAIMRIVRRGAPGTAAVHSPAGRRSTRKTVTRLLVRQVSRIVARRSGVIPASHRALGCLRGSCCTAFGPRNLQREPTAVLVDARWQLPSELVKPIDDTGELLLAFEIPVPECVRHVVVILLATGL